MPISKEIYVECMPDNADSAHHMDFAQNTYRNKPVCTQSQQHIKRNAAAFMY